MQLFQQYRPTTLDDVVGQEKIVQRIRLIESRSGIAGRSFWITGKSGHGKSTIASIMAESIADPFCIDELDASGITAATVQNIERATSTYGMGKQGRAVIINEAHGLRKDAIRQLLCTLERIPPHVAWLFTTTLEGQATLFDGIDASPLVSRCIKLELAQRGVAKAFAEYAYRIATAEGLTSKGMKQFERLAIDCGNNLRMMLSAVESGAMI